MEDKDEELHEEIEIQSSQTEEPKIEDESIQEKWNKCMDKCSDSVKGLNFEMVAFILLPIGILLLFTESLHYFGGTLIGLVTGCYFSNEIILTLKQIRDHFTSYSFPHKVVFSGFIVALLLTIPTIVLGAAVAGGICQLMKASEK